MRRTLLAIIVVLMVALTDTPAYAGESHILLDATVWVIPGETYRMCMDLPPGTLAATTRLVQKDGQAGAEAIEVSMLPYRGLADTPGIVMVASSAEAVSITPIIGGLQCLGLRHQTPIQPGENPLWRSQLVAVRLTIEPL